MADGTQRGFNFPSKALVSALRPGEIVVDFFAGGGGASEALRQALGRDPDVAVNHDHLAIGMHAANHPFTRHMEADVWAVDILREVAGRRVGWFHASPDCTHFSQAKGGQPRDRATRSLSWVVLKVAGTLARAGLAPRIISLENVRQILGWGPLIAKRDKATGRVIKLDGTVAAPGERVPLRKQFLVPDKKRAGQTWRQFVAALQRLGYVVEWRLLKACDYGAGTSRERLFLIGRCDGQPIVWPEPTHGPGRPQPFVTAADCIDWSIPCPSIFTRNRPPADATCRRIAKGVHRYVLGAAEPFICPIQESSHGGFSAQSKLPVFHRRTVRSSHRGSAVVRPEALHPDGSMPGSANRCVRCSSAAQSPSCTTAAAGARIVQSAQEQSHEHSRGSNGVRLSADRGRGLRRGRQERADQIARSEGFVRHPERHCEPSAAGAGFLTEHANTSRSACWTAGEPLRTQCAQVKGGHFALVTAFLEQAHGGGEHGNPARARGADEPVSTISTTGSHQRLVTADLAQLAPEHEAGALRVAAFLINYYGNGQALDLTDPVDTVTTRDRLALVTVVIRGTPYVIVDIGLRMLKPHELYRAQGFPADYIIDRTADGTPLSISAAVRMVGNSVSPPPLCAIARANLDSIANREAQAA